jgi:hypothetical protein
MTYKGYTIDCDGTRRLVYHPAYKMPVYSAPDLKDAKRFVNAYRDGTHWAMQAFNRAVKDRTYTVDA